MKRYIPRLRLTLCLIVLLVGSAIVLTGARKRPLTLLGTVYYYITHDYVDKDLSDTTLEYGAIRGLLKSLDDPYTRFLEPDNFSDMKARLEGQFYGIGIYIGIRDHQLTVISAIDGTPASRAGLQPLDKIVSIDGKLTNDLGLKEAVSHIRGEKGTAVILGIQRPPSQTVMPISIVRDAIEVQAVDKIEMFDGGIGYLRLLTFENGRATREFSRALGRLKEKQLNALIVDLRSNGGGLLRNAIDITSLLMGKGVVVYTIDRNGQRKVAKVSGTPLYRNKPLIVLINEGSASASEIVAGAIKDNNRGTIMGKQSFGKASVQKILNLPDGSAVLYTYAKYFTPSLVDISHRGVSVDIELAIPTATINAIRASKNYSYTYQIDYQLQAAIKEAKKQIKEAHQ